MLTTFRRFPLFAAALLPLVLLIAIASPLRAGAPAASNASPTPAFCGGSYWGNTGDAENLISDYPCRPTWPETGPEHRYLLQTTITQPLTLTLSFPPAADLDLFLIDNGEFEQCRAADAALHVEALPPGDHLIVVDGFDGSEGEYVLEIACSQTPQATPTPSATPRPTATPTPTPIPSQTPRPTITPTPPRLTYYSYFPQQHQGYPPPTPQPATIILQPGVNGYGGVVDSYINAWSISANYANVDRLLLRQPDVMAPLLRFDLSVLPANAHIVEAKLALWTLSQSNLNAATTGLYALHRPWEANQVTWQLAQAQEPWAEAGANALPADRSPDPRSLQPVDELSRWYEWDLTILAQQWLQFPQENHGVILKAFAEPRVQYAFASAGYHNPEARPRLTIRYWTPTTTN